MERFRSWAIWTGSGKPKSIRDAAPTPIQAAGPRLEKPPGRPAFIVGCDDTYAPQQYFGFFRISRIQVHVIPTVDGTSTAQQVLNRLTSIAREPDDEVWMLLDTDHCTQGTHVQGFVAALREAQQKGVRVALSKPCFEIWLLFHHMDEANVETLSACRDVEKSLRERLGGYNKSNLKSNHFPLESVSDACARAQSRDAAVEGGDIPAANTTRVYQLWQAIVSKALPSQLPPQLRGLLPTETST